MSLSFAEQQAIAILKSLTEIAVSGFKTLALLNGGALVALLTYLGHGPQRELWVGYVKWSMVLYVCGLLCCALAAFTAHGTQLEWFREIRAGETTELNSGKWLMWARGFTIASILLFLVGSIVGILGLVSPMK